MRTIHCMQGRRNTLQQGKTSNCSFYSYTSNSRGNFFNLCCCKHGRIYQNKRWKAKTNMSATTVYKFDLTIHRQTFSVKGFGNWLSFENCWVEVQQSESSAKSPRFVCNDVGFYLARGHFVLFHGITVTLTLFSICSKSVVVFFVAHPGSEGTLW